MTDTRDFLIKIISDAASVARTKSDVDATKRGLQDLESYAKTAGSALGGIERAAKLDSLGSQFGAMAVKIDDTTEATRRLAVALKAMNADAGEVQRAVTSFASAKQAAQDASGGSVGAKLTRFGYNLRAIPSIGLPGGVGSDSVANVIRLSGSLKEMADKAGIGTGQIASLGIGVAALGAVVLIAKAQFDAAKKAADADISGREKAIELLREGTDAEKQARINELQIKRDTNEAQLALANDLLVKLRQQVAGNSGLQGLGLAEIGAQIGLGGAEIKSAEDSFNKYNAAVRESRTELDLLTSQTGLSAQTTAQAAAAEERLNLARGYGARIQAEASQVLELQNLAATGSEKAVRDLIAAKEREIQVDTFYKKFVEDDAAALFNAGKSLEDQSPAYQQAIALATQYKNTIDLDTAALKGLNGNILDSVILNDKAAQAIKDQDAAQKEIDKVKKQVSDDEIDRERDIASLAEKNSDAYDKLAESFKRSTDAANDAAKNQDDKTSRTRSDEDAKDAEQLRYKLSKIDDDITEAEIKAKIDREKALAKIDKEFSLSSNLAIQNRDAVALQAAIDKRDKDKDDTEDSYKDDIKQAHDNAKKKRDDLQADFDEDQKLLKIARQNADRETAESRRLDAVARRNKYTQDQNDLQANSRAQILQRQNQYRQELQDLKDHLNDQEKNTAGYYGTILQYANLVKHDIDAILNGGGSSSSSVPSTNTSPTPTPHNIPTIPRPGHPVPTPDFDAGYVYGGTTGRGAGGITIPINVKGMGKNDILKTVNDHLSNELDKAGW